MENIIHIQNLNFSYNESPLLEDISMDLYEGDYAAIIGPNGSGKSTFIKLILGELKPDTGEILIKRGKEKIIWAFVLTRGLRHLLHHCVALWGFFRTR